MADEVQTVTITGGRNITETYDREKKVKVPAKKPFYSVECDGLPNGIDNFAIWPEMETQPGAFIVGKTYQIGGYVNGRYFNFNDTIIGEVEGAVPGVNGVPKDRELEITKGAVGHDAATITAAFLSVANYPPEVDKIATAIEIYSHLFEGILAYRLGYNHQTEAQNVSQEHSQPLEEGPGDFPPYDLDPNEKDQVGSR